MKQFCLRSFVSPDSDSSKVKDTTDNKRTKL
jgi:hypothetical protein